MPPKDPKTINCTRKSQLLISQYTVSLSTVTREAPNNTIPLPHVRRPLKTFPMTAKVHALETW